MAEKVVEKAGKKSWIKEHPIIFAVGMIFLVSGLFSLFAGDNSTQTNNESQQTTYQKQTQTQVKEYSINEPVVAGDFLWEIKGFYNTTQIGEYFMDTFVGEKADGVFLVFDVEVTNVGSSAEYLSDSYMKLIDSQGRKFSANSVAAYYLKPQGSAMTFDLINPGITKKGKVVFDVPANIRITDMRISSSLVESSFYNIKLIT